MNLTPELQQKIVASIRSGGYPVVSAEAWGVSETEFKRWIQQGRKHRARQIYKDFVLAVDQAQAQARLKAEMKAYEDDPRFWLKNGPGKEIPGKPGWSTMMKPIINQDQRTVNLFMSPEFLNFLTLMRTVLAPFPEAMAALTAAMDKPNDPPKVAPSQIEMDKS